MSRHGPGGDVLGHLGPAFLLTVTSRWPEKQKKPNTHNIWLQFHHNRLKQFLSLLGNLFSFISVHIAILVQNYDGTASGVYQADINHSSVIVFMSALNVQIKGVHIIICIKPWTQRVTAQIRGMWWTMMNWLILHVYIGLESAGKFPVNFWKLSTES